MAAILQSIKVNLKLNNGTSATGAVKTVSVSIAGGQELNATAYSTDLDASRSKALALANLISPILTKSVYEIRETMDNRLTN